jgi:hypothetical protein
MDIPFVGKPDGRPVEAESLSKGDVLTARVMESDPAGPALLKLGPRTMKAVMSRYVSPGETVKVQVAETSPRLVLRLMLENAPTPQANPGAGSPLSSEYYPQPDAGFRAGAEAGTNSGAYPQSELQVKPEAGAGLRTPPQRAFQLKSDPSRGGNIPGQEKETGSKPEGDPKATSNRSPAAPNASRGEEGSARDRPVISARIIERLDANRVRVRIEQAPDPAGRLPKRLQITPGREMTARLSGGPDGPQLTPGQTASFAVAKTWPQVVFQALESPGQRPALAKSLSSFLGDPGRLAQAAQALSQALDQLPGSNLSPEAADRAESLRALLSALAPRTDAPDPEFPPRLLSALGLAGDRSELAQSTARFLSELLKNPQWLSSKESGDIKSLLEAAVRVHDAAENAAVVNQETWRGAQSFFLPFPLFHDRGGRGELLLKKEDAGQSSDQPVRATLLLHMSKLGTIRADAAVNGRKVRGVIRAETSEAIDGLRAGLDRLVESLEARGFEPELAVEPFPGRPPSTLAAELAPPPDPVRGRGLIDVKV